MVLRNLFVILIFLLLSMQTRANLYAPSSLKVGALKNLNYLNDRNEDESLVC